MLQELEPQQVQVPRGQDGFQLALYDLVENFEARGLVVLLVDCFEDVDALDVVEEWRDIVCQRHYDVLKIFCGAILEEEPQQLLVDNVFV